MRAASVPVFNTHAAFANLSEMFSGRIRSLGTAIFAILLISACAGPKPVDLSMTREQRLAFLDAHAMAAPRGVESDAGKLLDYLLQPARDDAEKSRLISRWIADRFQYVLPSQEGDPPRRMSLNELLVFRRSQCEGFATAYEGLASKAGLKVRKIAGYAKGAPELLLDVRDKENHAWNAVRLDGRWYGVDVTWAAGTVAGGRYLKRFNPHFVQMEPEQMLLTHFSFGDELGSQRSVGLGFNEFLGLPPVAHGFTGTGFSVRQIIEGVRRDKGLTLVQTYDTPHGAFRVNEAPIAYRLKPGPQRFDLQSGFYEEMALVQGKAFVFFKRDRERFLLEHRSFEPGAAYIMGRKSGEAEFEGVLGYEFR